MNSRAFAQREIEDDAILAEYVSLKQELKDGAQWGRLLDKEVMKAIHEETLLEIEIERRREGLVSRETVREYPEEKRRWDQPKIRH